MKSLRNLVLGMLVTVASAYAGGGYAPNPQQDMYGGMERGAFFDGGRGQMPRPFQNPFQPGRGGHGMMRPPPHRREHPLLAHRTAVYWSRLDANGRAQFEAQARQWLASLPAEQQMFLSVVFQPGTSTATSTAAAAPTTTTVTYDPNTGLPIDPTTGYPYDPATGYLWDAANGSWIDRTTGQSLGASAPTTSTTATTPTTY